jgi:mannosyltransferase OCH1-like enzyme
MIPKIIHYCWLSNDPKPEVIRQCIASWRKYMPDYEIRLWNRDSFDFDSVEFTRDALANRKWAFVSDFVRLYALSQEGGIYLDSDVRAFGPVDKLLENDFFSGLEMRDKAHTEIYMEAAIMGAAAGHPFVKKALDYYKGRHFVRENGEMDLTPIPTILSEMMEREYGWAREDRTQHLADGITIYSTDVIANTNCPRKHSVKLYHFNSRSWQPQTFREKAIRSLKRLYRIVRPEN